MSTAEKIISLFGGQRRLADVLGHEHQTTVQGWQQRGVIPLRQIPLVIKAARRLGIDLKHEDFF
jgi:hypothetical protein